MNKLNWFLAATIAPIFAVGCSMALLSIGCSLALQPKSAERTMIGTSKRQVIAAAQQVVINEGLAIERADVTTGLVTTAWHERGHHAERYEITIQPVTDDEGNETGSLSLAVAGMARDRVVGGWSGDYPAGLESADLLDEIASLVAERAATTRVRRPTAAKPACKRSDDCPDGKHCGSGRCVAECAVSDDCESGRECDYKGRCVVPPPEPEPCPEPKCERTDAGAAASTPPGYHAVGEEVTR